MSGAVPAGIAAAFTQAEIAVLSVIAAEVRRAGSCDLPMDRIAALAGCCRRTPQYALRRAAAADLVQIEERPRPGRKHLPSGERGAERLARKAAGAFLRRMGGPRLARVQRLGCGLSGGGVYQARTMRAPSCLFVARVPIALAGPCARS